MVYIRNKNKQEYFNSNRVSASYIKAMVVHHCIHGDFNVKFEEDKEEEIVHPSLFIGEQVHNILETNGSSYHNLSVREPTDYDNLSKRERAIIDSDKPFPTCILEGYNNADTRLLQEIDPDKEMGKKQQTIYTKYYQMYQDLLTIRFNHEEQIEEFNNYITDDNIVINDIVFDPPMQTQEIYQKITNCYHAFMESKVYKTFLYSLEQHPDWQVFTEDAIYWEYRGVECKSLLDKYYVNHKEKKIKVIDYKTHHDAAIFFPNSYRKYKYAIQFAFYVQALKAIYPEYTMDFYCVSISTSEYDVEIYTVSERDLHCGRHGGIMKPIGSKFNDDEELNIYCSERQHSNYQKVGILNPNYNPEYEVLGFEQVIDYLYDAQVDG